MPQGPSRAFRPAFVPKAAAVPKKRPADSSLPCRDNLHQDDIPSLKNRKTDCAPRDLNSQEPGGPGASTSPTGEDGPAPKARKLTRSERRRHREGEDIRRFLQEGQKLALAEGVVQVQELREGSNVEERRAVLSLRGLRNVFHRFQMNPPIHTTENGRSNTAGLLGSSSAEEAVTAAVAAARAELEKLMSASGAASGPVYKKLRSLLDKAQSKKLWRTLNAAYLDFLNRLSGRELWLIHRAGFS